MLQPVTISLKSGSAAALDTVEVLTSTATGGSFTWTAPTDLTNTAYAFQINAGTDVNYSGFFSYTGGSGTHTTAAASSAAVSSAAVTSAAASTALSTAIATTTANSITTDTASTAAASSTLSSSTLRTLTTSTDSAPSATATQAIPSGAAVAGTVASPIALVFGAVIAMLMS
jgi:Ser-Thr-rich glycosyl-phosphatidyl-inositol-anchored membrane family